VIEASATPKYSSEESTDLYRKIVVTTDDVIDSGLIKKQVCINDNVEEIAEELDREAIKTAIVAGLKKRDELEKKYEELGINVNPLMAIQLPTEQVEKLSELDMKVRSIAEEILSEYEKKEYGFELAIRSAISRLFLQILRSWHSDGETVKQQDNDDITMEKVMSYVEQNYMDEVLATTAARISGMSYSYFSRFFKRAAGMSFTEYLNSVRIEKAAEMLLSSTKTVTEIAMDTGFSSTSYFIARFKEQKRMTPASFRAK
jgi:AraC-like DNA-binding protein